MTRRARAATLLLTITAAAFPGAIAAQRDLRTPAIRHLAAPITRWDDGFPLGNGTLGALVWGGDSTINISLDRGDLWDERRPAIFADSAWTWAAMQQLVATDNMARFRQLFDEPYDNLPYPTKLPVGRLVLTWSGRTIDRFELDLAQAEAWVIAGGDTVKVAALSDREAVLVQGPIGVDWTGVYESDGLRQLYGEPTIDVVTWPHDDLHAVVSEIRTSATQSFAITTWARKRHVTTVEVVVTPQRTVHDSLPWTSRWGTTTGAVTIATDNGWEAATAGHRDWWRSFWGTSSVTIPDTALQAHYDFVKYLYGAAARRGGAPIALQGLWTADNGALPPWKGDYHNNLNTQMTYLAAHAAGADEAMLGWLDHLEARMPVFQQFARDFYGLEHGAVIPGVMSLAGHPLGGWGMYSLSPTNGAWVAWSFWKHWRMTRDSTFLRERAYPFVREVARGLDDLLVRGPGDVLVLPLSSSPEIGDNRREAFVTPNSNYDQALLTWIFAALFEMASELGDGTDAGYWRVRGEQLAPLATRESGELMVARNLGYDASHRHFSHALAIHPLGLPLDTATVQATLDEIVARGTSQWTGYSFAWFAAMLARAGRANDALRYLTDYLAFTGRNGFHLNGDQSGRGLSEFTYRPFTLEGNFLAMEAIHEMLLRSDGSLLEVFPATPTAWSTASFDRLRADGGWIVSARRENGRVTQVTVEATVDALLRLRDPFGGAPVAWRGATMVREGPEWVGVVRGGATVSARTR